MLKPRKFILALALVFMVLSPVTVFAQSTSNYQRRIDNLNAEIARKQAELNSISSQADTLENKLRSIEAEVSSLQASIDKAQLQIAQTQGQIQAAIAKLEKQKRVMFENARVLYKMGSPTTIEILASSDNFTEFINRQEYLETVKDAVNQAAQAIIALKGELEAKQKDLEEFVKQQQIQRQIVDNKRQEQAEILAQTRGEEAKYQSLVQSLKKQKEVAEAALAASISSGSYKVSPVGPVSAGDIVGAVGSTGLSSGDHLHLEVRPGNECGPTANPGPYIKVQPVQPPLITQNYANPDPLYRNGCHPGIDYGASKGTPIHAIDSGNLYRGCSNQMLKTEQNEYGYVAIVEHSNGHVSVYAHMSGGPDSCNYNTWY